MKPSKGSVSSGEFSVALTKDSFDKLKKDVDKLKKKVSQLVNLSSNSDIIEAVRQSEGEIKPVQDMFQLVTVQKRLDTAETIMKKLCSMVEDLIKASGGSTEMLSQLAEVQKEAQDAGGGTTESAMISIERRLAALESAMASGGVAVPQLEGGAVPEIGSDVDLSTFDLNSVSIQTAMEILKKRLTTLSDNLASVPQLNRDVEEIKKLLNTDPEAAPPEMRLKMLEHKFGDTMDQLSSLDNNYCRQLNALQNRVTDMERETADLLEKANVGGGATAAEVCVSDEVAAVVASLQEEMTMLTENMERLVNDKEKGDHLLDVISEQVELLKTIKADREDLEDALADKADACQINRKVSFDQFDQACGDMNRTIEEALSKLGQQEMLWNQALMDIQNSVGNKLDRMELNPLRDFINNKLRSLQDKFRTLTALKKEQEAAGTKSKYLRNVNCISCDKDVVMRKEMDPTQFPKPYAAQPNRSMGPYLAYELDQLRKQQKCAPSSKNMNIFENALQAGKSASRAQDHICNRYCGGSHTVTTPQQRVTRLGHFLEQWGPELAPVNDTHIRGIDGKMYKARDDEFLKKMASEKPPAQHAELPPPIQVVAGGEDAPKQSQEGETEVNAKRSTNQASTTQQQVALPNAVTYPSDHHGAAGAGAGHAPSSTAAVRSGSAQLRVPESPKGSVTAHGAAVDERVAHPESRRASKGSVGRTSRGSKDMTQSKSQSLPKVHSQQGELIAPAEASEDLHAEG
ncbi:unnamed protein product [Acanthoscelides obtectus]|nr:unnamed protein product [Acanthoscelides obtectus]CAK1637760.1 Glutamine-rich protein 2 [Acanthoscelides obtectus]